MRRALLFMLLPSILIEISCYTEFSALDHFLPLYRSFKLGATRSLVRPRNLERMRQVAIHNDKAQPQFGDDVPFPCELNGTRSDTKPTSVHKLRPGDIDVIGSIGDSLTVGYGIYSTNVIELLMSEMRGGSFSGGGLATWRQFLTLPNILKEFNPNLIGYATAHSVSIQRESQFNVAEGGAVSHNMPYMTKILIKRILNDPRVDVANDWKLITIMMGSNDMCSESCYFNDPRQMLQRHREDLLQTLRTLKTHLPRTLINLIPALNPLLLHYTDYDSICRTIHVPFCPCLFGLAHMNSLSVYGSLYYEWQMVDVEVGNMDEFHTDDFTVVVQPVSINLTAPERLSDHKFDLSFLSSDCFHFSQKGYSYFAKEIWKNMLEPVGGKTRAEYYEPLTKLKCPTEDHPYIFTNKNSVA